MERIVRVKRGYREWMEGGKGTYDVDEDIERTTFPFLDQLGGVVVRPFRFIVQVAGESFLAPGALARVRDWGVGGDGFVFAWVLQELDESSIISLVLLCPSLHCFLQLLVLGRGQKSKAFCSPRLKPHGRPCCGQRY